MADALEILVQDFSRSPFFVLKDPRICRLLPFWLTVFREFGANVKCVLPLRNPLEIAASLNKRDGFSPAKSYMIWLRYVLDAEKATRKLPRVFIAYDTLLDDWRGAVGEVSKRLGVSWPRWSAASEVEIDRFLDERHRHHSIDQAGIDQRSEVAGWVRGASRAIAELVADPYAKKPQKRLDAIRAEFNRASDALGAVLLAEELAREEAEQGASRHAAESGEAAARLSQREDRIQELEQLAAEKDGTIERLSATVTEREEKVAESEQRVAEQDAVIDRLRTTVTERDEKVAELEQRAAEQNAAIGQLRATVTERDKKIAEMEQRSAEQNAAIGQLRATVTERDKKIAEMEQRSAEQNAAIGQLRATVTLRDEKVAESEQRAAVQAGEIGRLRQILNEQKGQIAGLQQDLEKITDVLANSEFDLQQKIRTESFLLEARARLTDERNRLLHRLNKIQTKESFGVGLLRGESGRPSQDPSLTKRGLPPRKCFGSVLSRKERRRLRREVNLLLSAGLLDVSWYIENNLDVVLAGADPVWHWATVGWLEGRDPNPLFDTDWYLAKNPDVADAGIDPLVHYLRHGAGEGRDPNPFFDTDWYLAHNPDLREGEINLLVHYLRFGGQEQRDPSPLFDTSFYLKNNPDVVELGINPLVHFFANGADAAEAKEVWSDIPALREVGASITVEGKKVQLQPSERFVTASETYNPKVTAVVPNFNHARYLRERLDSIYQQTYSNIHVVLLDDCSSDNSREILAEYKNKFPDKTTVVLNEVNSGGVFRQWRKGIEMAESELIWIAESDDFCDKNFLCELIPYFMDEAVSVAYSHSVFVDESGRESQFAFENYLAELSPDRWRSSYVATAHDEVAQHLGKKNTIPNVSSAVFRKPDLTPLVQDDRWLSMKICGDWVFYLHLLKGGKIAYSVDTHNYFRFHSSNSSAKTYSKPDYYREHEFVACEVARNYRVPDETLEANRSYIERFYNDNAAELAAAGVRFSDLFDDKRVSATRAERKPNLMMAAFALSTGGGEVFPIRLANYLKTQGYALTFFNFMGDAFNPAMRRMLRSDIPLVERNEWCPEVELILDQFGIEVVHTHHASVDVYFGSHNKVSNAGARHVVTMHGMYEAMSEEIFDLTLGKIADEVATWVYIAEKNLAPFKSAELNLRGGFRKIPNGMQPPKITRLNRSDYNVPEEAFLVCLASRAIPEKGWRKAIEIVEVAREVSNKDIHLLLLGDGPVYDELNSEQLPDYAHLLGFRENVVDYYAMSDMGLLPTTFEGESFPLSIIECFMAGRPIMVSDVGEVRNMLSAQSGEAAGVLLDTSGGKIDENKAGQMLALLAKRDRDYNEKRSLAKRLAKRFDIDKVCEEYGDVYTKN
jgi:glycosyltransferase involved in cell wall biosynthesis